MKADSKMIGFKTSYQDNFKTKFYRKKQEFYPSHAANLVKKSTYLTWFQTKRGKMKTYKNLKRNKCLDRAILGDNIEKMLRNCK